jgi:hypothetical protein
MKVIKTNDSNTDALKIKELMKQRNQHQAIVDELNKKIRKLVYKYDTKNY